MTITAAPQYREIPLDRARTIPEEFIISGNGFWCVNLPPLNAFIRLDTPDAAPIPLSAGLVLLPPGNTFTRFYLEHPYQDGGLLKLMIVPDGFQARGPNREPLPGRSLTRATNTLGRQWRWDVWNSTAAGAVGRRVRLRRIQLDSEGDVAKRMVAVSLRGVWADNAGYISKRNAFFADSRFPSGLAAPVVGSFFDTAAVLDTNVSYSYSAWWDPAISPLITVPLPDNGIVLPPNQFIAIFTSGTAVQTIRGAVDFDDEG